jgi:peroxiredoxin
MRTGHFLICAALLVPLLAGAQSLSNRRAPSFALPDTKMQSHDILDYRGRWLLLDFMETNCPHCKALTKSLEQLKKKLAGKVEVLSVVVPPENMATVGKYITENGVTSPILFDSSQVAITYFKATPAKPSFDTPHLFAIDPNGWIVKDYGQQRAEDPALMKELETMITSAANKK